MAPTTLLLCLLAATVLGAGACGARLWHLCLVGRHRRALDAMLAEERERSEARHEELCRQVACERARAEQIIARHDALAAHAREQGRRAERFRAEASGLEARHMKLQRDLACERAGRRAGRAAPRPETPRDKGSTDARGVSSPALEPWEIDRLPVLNRRVGTRARRGRSSTPVFPIGTDLDIPTLAESELPDANDELPLDTGSLLVDADER